jgi:hypothetical protein
MVARSVFAANGCSVWLGATYGKGMGQYGRIGAFGIPKPVHVLSYEMFVGPIPPGFEIDHKCKNRFCWNPNHLEPVTHKENILRGESLSAQNRRKTECKRGHPFSGENLIIRPDGSRYCRECMRRGLRERYWRKRAQLLEETQK